MSDGDVIPTDVRGDDVHHSTSSEPMRSIDRLFGGAFEGLGRTELALLGIIALFPIAWLPVFVVPTVPRLALAAALAPFGLALVVRGARRRDLASVSLLAVLVSATVSAILAAVPMQALKGDLGSWMSVAVYAAAAGWWGVGSALGDRARELIPRLLLLGVAFNGLVGIVQIVFEVYEGLLATSQGRATGLLDNSVYYGSFMVGVAAWWTVEAARSPRRYPVAVAAAVCFVAGLSGSRVAFVAVVMVATAVVLLWRTWRSVIAWAAAVGGFVVCSQLVSVVSARGTISRFSSGESVDERTTIWQYGLEAFVERPLFGWGLNHYDTAISRRITADYVATNQYNDLAQPWLDPHNVPVMLLTSLGAVGVGLLVVFVVAGSRGKVEPAFLGGAVAIAATWLLQPATIHSLPIAMLLFGLARRPSSAAGRDPVTFASRRASAVGLGLGAVMAAYLLVVTFAIDKALQSGDVEAAVGPAALLPADPALETLIGRYYQIEALASADDQTSRHLLEQAIAWSLEAAHHSGEARRWNRVAELQIIAGDVPSALESVGRALDIQPWNPTSHRRMLFIADISGDRELFDEAHANVCLLDLPECTAERYDRPPVDELDR